jgi:hypothetical protein
VFPGDRATVQVFSGGTGARLHTLLIPATTRSDTGFGFAVGSGVDVDRDGVSDIIVGARNEPINPPNHYGAVFVFSGRDGSMLYRLIAERSTLIGAYLAARDERPLRPWGTFVVCEPHYGPNQTSLRYEGRIRLFRGPPLGVGVYGTACAGTLGKAPQIGLQPIEPWNPQSRTTRVHVSSAPAGEAAVLLLGLSRTSWAGHTLPLALDPMFPGCTLYTAVDVYAVRASGTSGIGAGYAWVDLPLRLERFGALQVYGQWLVTGWQSGSPGVLSDALAWRH